jgi:hypothetical protein
MDGFWSTLIGAIVGGAMSLLGTYLTLRTENQNRKGERAQVQKALAHSLLVKVAQIASQVQRIHLHLDGSGPLSPTHSSTVTWKYTEAIANPDAVSFSIDELGMLMGLQNEEVFNAVMQLDAAHNRLISGVKAYNIERTELAQMWSEKSFDQATATSTADQDAMNALRPRVFAVNALLAYLRTEARDTNLEARDTAEKLQVLLRKTIGIEYRVTFLTSVPGDGVGAGPARQPNNPQGGG